MAVTATSSEELFVGAGDLYADNLPAGATMDDTVFRVVRSYFRPNLNGVRGPLKNTDYVVEETAEIEATIAELSTNVLGFAIPGVTTTALAADGTLAGGGGDTTLAAASAIGATNVKVTAITNFTAGDAIQIGPTGLTREFRTILVVGTVGAGGTGIDLSAPLSVAHGNGEVFQEVASTTLAAASAVGATNIKVASIAGLVAGNYLMIGFFGSREIRKIVTVGTIGAGGTGVDLDYPLSYPQRSGDPVIQMTGSGASRITSGPDRRLPPSAYHNYRLVVPGLAGRRAEFNITSAIMGSDTVELTAGDESVLAPRLVLQARWDPASPNTIPWWVDRFGTFA